MNRYKLFIDFAREEKWLADMARQGWELNGVGVGYQFKATRPEPAAYRIDYRVFASQAEFVNYVTLFEDSGWQHVAGGRNNGAQYFKRLSAGGDAPAPAEDIFSDALSRAERYKRFSHLWLALAAAFLVILSALAASGAADLRALVQPGRFYLTPGLWERTGAAFWQAFWFETPFALFRAALLYSFPLSLACYLAFAIQSHRLYQKEKNRVSAA